MSAPLSREGAIELLAQRLRWKMEHLDPSGPGDPRAWER